MGKNLRISALMKKILQSKTLQFFSFSVLQSKFCMAVSNILIASTWKWHLKLIN